MKVERVLKVIDRDIDRDVAMPSPPPSEPRVFTRLKDIEPREVQWLWQDRIPLGEITACDGDPSATKSGMLLDIASRLSAGRAMPGDTSGIDGGVLLLVGEDSIAKTVVPRLNAAKADMSRVAVVNSQVSLPDDLAVVEEGVVKMAAKLLVIDPLMVFLGRNANSDRAVRQAMTPLKQLAERHQLAVVLVRHLTKSGSRSSLYRGSGSVGIIAAVRSSLFVGHMPDDSNMRVVCHVKSNLGPLAPSLLFEPVTRNGILGIEWGGECDLTADDLLGRPKTTKKLDEAKSFLLSLLAAGPVEQKVIEAKGRQLGIAYRTVERAKRLLDIKSQRKGCGANSVVYWAITQDASATDPIDRQADLAVNGEATRTLPA